MSQIYNARPLVPDPLWQKHFAIQGFDLLMTHQGFRVDDLNGQNLAKEVQRAVLCVPHLRPNHLKTNLKEVYF